MKLKKVFFILAISISTLSFSQQEGDVSAFFGTSYQLVDYQKGKKIKKLEIKKIEFRTTSCYGECPIFQIKIDSKLNVKYRGYQFTNSKGVRNFKFSSKA